MNARRLSPAALAATTLLAALAGCGGNDDEPGGLPRLAAATPATLSGTCADLASRLTLANTTITSTTDVPAGTLLVGGQPIAQHCRVVGSMYPRTGIDGNAYAIGFEMRLPNNWNGRFFYQANGGIDGNVGTATGAVNGGPGLTNALHMGFAVISSDAGHSGALGPNFGIDPQARLDYGYQAVQKLTPMAKSLIQTAYGKQPDRSYFGGCSNGGRHTMVAMSRFADQYDGFLAGAPGYNLPKAAIANIFGAQRYALIDPANLANAFTPAERTTVANAVLAKCDALDGATDGLVQDVEACRSAFNFATDVPTCPGARDGSCLTTSQKVAFAPIFSGATTSTGRSFYASFPYDPGIASSGIPFWEFIAPVALDTGGVGQIWKVPPEPVAGFNGASFALNMNIDLALQWIDTTNATYTESAMSFMTPPNPTQLSTLKNRGAKVMVYHGVADPIFSVDDTKAWYDGLRANNGGDASNFAKFYRVPGMGHCSGGPATDQFDMLTPLVAWVEQGTEPQAITATARGTGNAAGANAEVPGAWGASRTRPLCPYPKVARYDGTGDVNLAASFTCQ
ncbi:tannase/feruloyl esterase family alpha/beta hydrolase [Piscinibacter gummiphilus]|uniref:Tannase/feruloyl esterase family alpha/beta hydrolase n=1 Tax=Piscinibacter gummiphilus TaxID=946333 RepID=A0ABZ0D088_9BURK|nr:tannase/feruloyl esterase family alpha/beta hydrolase [Piscinibacter gummiphilus]WOB08846.1 tannase/feruloyl esterase family alpha/beta hydrolase [Piscinibacter gummiphilus]